MKHLTLIALATVLIHVTGNTQGFLKAAGTRIVNSRNENVLLRGIGLGGWMLQEGYMLKIKGDGQQYRIRERIEELIGKNNTDSFYNAWLLNHTTKADIDSLKVWGFNSVRLLMHYKLYMPGGKGFAITDSLLAWCKANSLYLILDLHAAPGGQGKDLNISDRDSSQPSLWQNDADYQQTIDLWKQVATRYSNEPWIGAYDILNELNWGFDDPKGDKCGLLPPWDDNMVLSFHKYWNFNSQASVQSMISLRDKYNMPIWVGETGENSNVWFAEAVRLMEKNNIGWAWWPLKKLGVNNPLEIPVNQGYRKIVNYWAGTAEKPSSSEALDAFMELAGSANIHRNIIHRDVIDALFRQPFSNTAIPFATHIITANTILRAVDYDMGNNGVAYYDLDTANYRNSSRTMLVGNKGASYRNDGVDITDGEEHTGQYYITDMKPGEWLQYTIQLKKKGTYTIELVTKGSGAFSVKAGGNSFPAQLADTSGKWANTASPDIRLVKGGRQSIRIAADSGLFELKEIRFIQR